MPKLVRSFALDALEIRSDKPYQPKTGDAEDLLKKSAAAKLSTHKGVGEGENVRLQSEDVVGSALVVDEKVIHLSVFRNDEQTGQNRYHSGRPSRVLRRSKIEASALRSRCTVPELAFKNSCEQRVFLMEGEYLDGFCW